jgi:hypothetical protein
MAPRFAAALNIVSRGIKLFKEAYLIITSNCLLQDLEGIGNRKEIQAGRLEK